MTTTCTTNPMHPPAAATPPTADLGPTVADFLAVLIAEHSANWSTQPGNEAWWKLQLSIVASCYTYRDDDPRLTEHNLAAGSSKHFSLLTTDDCREAMFMRRAVNLAARNRNNQRRRKYEKGLAAWEAGQNRTGGGRRPKKPVEPTYEQESTTDTDTYMISPRTEQVFGMVQSFTFDRAHEAGLFPYGNMWRKYQPRGHGGRGQRKGPYRTPEPLPPTERTYPGAGFFIDLGDALAQQGQQYPDGRRTGERYRILPLIAWQAAPRPGELTALRADELPTAGASQTLHVHGLKHGAGAVRDVDLADLSAQLLTWHVASDLHATNGELFASPAGCPLDFSNWTEDFLRPAFTALTADDGLWTDLLPATDNHSAPSGGPISANLFRKAGVSSWLAYGLDPSHAAAAANHTETVQIRYYKGMVSVARRRGRVWTGMNDYLRTALADTPPRGNGPLATWTRSWLSNQA